jgi:putative ABC transport system ATP-binding protein
METHSATILEVKHLKKHFGDEPNKVTVLDGIDLTLGRGSFNAIMGASGAGKSTLLHLLAGLIAPDSGEIIINGIVINAMSDHEVTCFRRRHIGLVFQDFNLVPSLSVEENITLPLLLDRRLPQQTRVSDLLNKLGLFERRRHLPSQLSGGERQRAAIARALITDPDIILADEPTGNLDSPTGYAFCDLLRHMNSEEGRTVLLVSHDPVVAATAEQVHLLKDGCLAGAFRTAHDAALVSAHYLETMAKNS